MLKTNGIWVILPPFLVLIFAFFIPFSAFSIGEEESLMSIKKGQGQSFSFGKKKERRSASVIKRSRPRGNLPTLLIRRNQSRSVTKRKNPIQFPELSPVNKSGMDVGDIFDCIISQDIKAYAGSISPIRAEVLSGENKGTIFIGNATMDPKTKDIVVEFNLARDLSGKKKHKLKATLHSQSGEIGLKGTFHSKYWQYFFATVMARGAEGYAQASVQRDRNIFGNYQEIPNQENAGKTALAEAASETANVISGGMKNRPEFVTKKGPIWTKIFITETPKLIN